MSVCTTVCTPDICCTLLYICCTQTPAGRTPVSACPAITSAGRARTSRTPADRTHTPAARAHYAPAACLLHVRTNNYTIFFAKILFYSGQNFLLGHYYTKGLSEILFFTKNIFKIFLRLPLTPTARPIILQLCTHCPCEQQTHGAMWRRIVRRRTNVSIRISCVHTQV